MVMFISVGYVCLLVRRSIRVDQKSKSISVNPEKHGVNAIKIESDGTVKHGKREIQTK
jgi:hypothetical protein